MKNNLIVLLLSVLILQCISPALAQEETCPMTLDSLPDCIKHHWENGDISNQRVYKSLLAKADAAIEARDHGRIRAAIVILKVFIHEVRAQSPKKITPEAASHMIMHAQTIIKDLRHQKS
jgi:hypothetical protein